MIFKYFFLPLRLRKQLTTWLTYYDFVPTPVNPQNCTTVTTLTYLIYRAKRVSWVVKFSSTGSDMANWIF